MDVHSINAKRNNGAISCIKGLAIISVICAHCNSTDIGGGVLLYSSLLLQNLGTLGVICFFILSGALFSPKKEVKFWLLNKIFKLCVPWLISGVCVFLYVYLRKPPITFLNFIYFFIGNGSYLYYLTILVLLYLIFYFLPFMRNIYVLIACQIISVVSGVFFYSPFGISPYINIFNWIGYFAFGAMLSKYKEKTDNMLKTLTPWRWIFYMLYLGVLVFQLWQKKGGFYFNGLNVPFCWIGVSCIFFIGIRIQTLKCNWARNLFTMLGDDTLFIYLWHMPVADIVANLMSY